MPSSWSRGSHPVLSATGPFALAATGPFVLATATPTHKHELSLRMRLHLTMHASYPYMGVLSWLRTSHPVLAAAAVRARIMPAEHM